MLHHSTRLSTLKAYIPLFIPIFANFFSYSLLRMVEMVFIRHLSNKEDALTASQLSRKIFFPPIFFLSGFNDALSVITAQLSINKEYKKATEAFKGTLLISFIISGFFGMIFFFFPGLIITRTQQSVAVTRLALGYLPILAVSMIPLVISMCIRRYLRGLTWFKSSTFINLSGAAANIIIGYLLVHGYYGFPNLGLYGLPWAIVISRVLTCVLSLCFLVIIKKKRLLMPTNTFSLHKPILQL